MVVVVVAVKSGGHVSKFLSQKIVGSGLSGINTLKGCQHSRGGT